jgi:hypothetical protein
VRFLRIHEALVDLLGKPIADPSRNRSVATGVLAPCIL